MPTRRPSSVWRGPLATVLVAAISLIVGLGVVGALVAGTVAGSRGEPVPAPMRVPHVAGYGLEELSHACSILAAGRDLGLGERDQTIAVMTAMGESSLRNIDYGDWETSGVTNPDGTRTTSIGLFQQQDNWGSREERLDPYTSATLFFHAMTRRVPERAELEPTLVAHRTQVNDDPSHYARFWDSAVRVVAALNGAPLSGDSTVGIPLCPAA